MATDDPVSMAMVTDANQQPPQAAVPEGAASPAGADGAAPAEAPAATPSGEAAPAAETAATEPRRSWLRRRGRRIDPGTGADAADPASTQDTTVIPVPVPDDGQTTVIPAAEPPKPPKPPRRPSAAALRRERAALMARREEMIFHLGGLAYELYRHDLLGHEVAKLRAGRVAELDQAVYDIDRRLLEGARREHGAPPEGVPAEAGCCLACRAVFFADARFCMQCGSRLIPVPDDPAGAATGPESPAGATRVIPAVDP